MPTSEEKPTSTKHIVEARRYGGARKISSAAMEEEIIKSTEADLLSELDAYLEKTGAIFAERPRIVWEARIEAEAIPRPESMSDEDWAYVREVFADHLVAHFGSSMHPVVIEVPA